MPKHKQIEPKSLNFNQLIPLKFLRHKKINILDIHAPMALSSS